MTVQQRRDVRSASPSVSRGGRANEAGSLYRSGVAAYLAAHGLVGRGVQAAGYSESGPAPVKLSFETGEAVDDIGCGLADGTTLRLQAKRACGADVHLTATVVQWAGQVGNLQRGDKIGLATAEPKGPVKNLVAALDRRRRAVPGPFPPGEAKALGVIRARMPAGTSARTADQVLGAAVVMTVAVSSSSQDEGFRSVANLLDGTVVPPGSGSAAIAALQRAFQEQAVAGTGSDLDEWLQILAEARLQVFPDADGPAGPRRRAELDAVAAYRQRMASRGGILEYSLLADDLPPMTYKPLADTLCVAVAGHDLGDADFLDTARRWPRMLLTGLPGMGKSTALEQAAARWAADASAPIPVLVPLRDLARRHPGRGSDITLPVLIEAATAAAPEQERVPLRRALQQAATSGEAVLLLDGLDECRHRRAVVADGLAAITGELPADTEIVLATRDSGLLAAARLNLPEARLTPPAHLESMLGQLLQHAAMFRVPEAERDQWVREREQQLEEIRSSHPDLWRIPLFATLLTLLIARPAPTTLPASRAQLLTDAVQETVDRWELTRLSETAPDLNVRAGQLLDGYGEIAHALIAESGGCPEGGVSQRVEAMLAERWALAPGEASARAREIMWFWDEHVGVFVASPIRDIEPRSRIFAEAGDAMWAVSQDPRTRRDRITAALIDDDRREAVIIAAGLSADVAGELIEAAGNAADPAAHSRGLLWAADATADGAEPATASLTTLIDALAHAADAAGHATSEMSAPGDVPRLHSRAARRRWPYVLRIAMLPLPSTLRPRRDHALTALELDDNEQALATALAALADARTDVRDILEPEQEAAVCRLLALPLPDRKPPPQSRPGRFVIASRQDKLLPGHHQAAEQAARYAAQLGQDAAAAIYRIARRGSLHDYARVCSRMIPLGYPDPEPPRVSLGLTDFAKGATDLWAGWEAFFAAAASLAPPRPLTAAECWRYPDIATLTGVLGAQEATLAGVGHAFTTDQLLLPGSIRAAAHAAALDLSAISAQAAIVLETWPEGNRDVINLMFAPLPAPLPACDASRLDQQDKDILIEALGATSDWLADIAYTLLLPAHDPIMGQRAADHIRQISPDRRADAAIIAIANHPCPPGAAARLLDGNDPPTRVGAATAADMLAASGDAHAWTPVLTRAKADADLTVRLAAGADQATARTAAYWSCPSCGQANDIDARECAFCENGMRPSARRSGPAAS